MSDNPTPGDDLVERLERVAGRSIGFRRATDPDDRLMIRRGDVQAAVLALRTRDEAARSSATEVAWQPIETAPLDGASPLILWNGAEVAAGYPWEGVWVDYWHDLMHPQPTHWQQLPAPPEALQSKDTPSHGG